MLLDIYIFILIYSTGHTVTYQNPLCAANCGPSQLEVPEWAFNSETWTS